MKKFFILCLMAFVMCVNANGQQRFEDGIYRKRENNTTQNKPMVADIGIEERVNGEIYYFSEASNTFFQPTFCHFNNLTEQWTEVKKDMVLQIKRFYYNNNPYYVLYYQYKDGYYKYRYSRVGWREYTAHMYILLTEEDYNRFVNCEGYCEFDFYYYTHGGDENQIIRTLMTTKNYGCVKFVIVSDNNVVRFDFSERHGGTIVSYNNCQNELKTTYFELTRKEWNKLKLD